MGARLKPTGQRNRFLHAGIGVLPALSAAHVFVVLEDPALVPGPPTASCYFSNDFCQPPQGASCLSPQQVMRLGS